MQHYPIARQHLQEWQKAAKEQAIAADISPKEVDWFLRDFAGVDRLALQWDNKPDILAKMPLSELERLWQRRICDRVPLQYLLGQVTWRHFTLKVSPAVLIPRPETELLIDLIGESVRENPELASGHWTDLGTGSGAIALGLAAILPAAKIHAVDRSTAAIAIARENTRMLGFSERIEFYCGSWWQPLTPLRGKISGMVSNPPYIPTPLIPRLQAEVCRHEPHLALDGGEDGLASIRHLAATAADYLHSGGLWGIEMMAGQGEAIAQLLETQGHYGNIRIYPDLAGLPRFVVAHRL